MSPHDQKLFGSQPDASKCQPFGVECWLYVRAEQRQDYADAMSRPDAKLWREAFNKEMSGLVQNKVLTVVERPVDRNPLGTTMVYKYKIDRVKNTVTRNCRLSLRGDWQKEGIDFFRYKTFSAVLNCRENRTLYSLTAAKKWHMFSSDITQAFTYGKLDVPLLNDCFAIHRLDSSVLKEVCWDSTIVFMELNSPQQVSKVL
jgi:hypothetical protein